MYRRGLLRSLGLGVAALAGCVGGGAEDRSDSSPARRTAAPGARFRDVELPVRKSALVHGAPRDGIPAITDPAFGQDWSGLDRRGPDLELFDHDEVIGVLDDGRARAYPLRILDFHEIVNDEFGGPLLVTFCPLCGSGMTAVRQVDGSETVFGVSGVLFRNDLVMYDEATDSRWSQIMATAIRGPRTGETLELRPSSLTTWRAWRDAHPDTEVLLPPPASGLIVDVQPREYRFDRYASYEASGQVGIGGDNPDDRLHQKTWVVGVSADGVARAYPFPAVLDAGVVNDTVGSLPVVVAATAGGVMAAYDRRVDGETREFERDGRSLVAGGSRFRLDDGVAVDGPHEGARLEQASAVSRSFWFAWASFHPETEVWSP